jgi:hypothetical protein
MTDMTPPAPDAAALSRDLGGMPFRLGAMRGKWSLELLQFPKAYFSIAAPARGQGPSHFLLQADCTGYRAAAPTSQLWDARNDEALPLALRPMDRIGGVLIAFSDGCGACLYHPIDRTARGHWPNNHNDLAWGPTSTIVTLLETVHGLLLDSSYFTSAAPSEAADLRRGPLADLVAGAA